MIVRIEGSGLKEGTTVHVRLEAAVVEERRARFWLDTSTCA